MRTGLTQRGWNNVLIFASLFMILLFNTTHQKFISNDSGLDSRSLLTAEQIITSIDFSGIKFERIGPSWRVSSQIELREELNPTPIINAWKQLPLMASGQVIMLDTVSASFPVTVFTAGQSDILIFEVFVDSDNQRFVIEDKASQLWYEVTKEDLLQLVPIALFNLN